jgi:signal transduction histidine kinase
LVALRPTAVSYNTLLTLFEAVQRNPGTLPEVPLDRFRQGSEAHHLLAGFQTMLQRIERTQKAREDAALAERSRLARELHDAVSQTLFSASLIADVLPRLWDRNPDIAHERLHELRELTRGALGEMRTLLVELRPAALVKADLTELIAQLADAIVGRARLPVEVTFEGRISPPVDVKIALYRIVQEALNNVVKHARASEAALFLKSDSQGNLELRITDDGRGFDLQSVSAGSFGLGIMEERATAIGADLTIKSQIGDGTTIILTWPGPGQASREQADRSSRLKTH